MTTKWPKCHSNNPNTQRIIGESGTRLHNVTGLIRHEKIRGNRCPEIPSLIRFKVTPYKQPYYKIYLNDL